MNYLDNWKKVNWIKLDGAVCSTIGLNKRNYLRNTVLGWGY